MSANRSYRESYTHFSCHATRMTVLVVLAFANTLELISTGVSCWRTQRTFLRSPWSSSSWTRRYLWSCAPSTAWSTTRRHTCSRRSSWWTTTVTAVRSSTAGSFVIQVFDRLSSWTFPWCILFNCFSSVSSQTLNHETCRTCTLSLSSAVGLLIQLRQSPYLSCFDFPGGMWAEASYTESVFGLLPEQSVFVWNIFCACGRCVYVTQFSEFSLCVWFCNGWREGEPLRVDSRTPGFKIALKKKKKKRKDKGRDLSCPFPNCCILLFPWRCGQMLHLPAHHDARSSWRRSTPHPKKLFGERGTMN